MIARFPNLQPSDAIPPAPISDTVPWGISYTYGAPFPTVTPFLPAGTYTLDGKFRGTATVVVTDNATNTMITGIAVTYHDYGDNCTSRYVINGTESVQNNGNPSPLHETVTWFENLIRTGVLHGSKVTGSGGFTVGPSLLLSNDFEATGTMTTTINGRTYTQPGNGS
jgi:hypothetical protein